MDFVHAVAFRDTSDIVVVGTTNSPSAIATWGAHQTTLGGDSDAFVATLSGTGNRMWGTYYGGTDADFCVTVALTPLGDIVLGGGTHSDNAIATAGSHQVVRGDSTDAFVALLTRTGAQRWGTYFSGSEVDFGNAVAVSPSGGIVLAGETSSKGGIALEGAHQLEFGGVSDVFLAVFRQDTTTSVTVKTMREIPLSIAGLRPNPAATDVVVTTRATVPLALELIDGMGRTVATVPVEVGTAETTMPIGHLPQGRYQLRMVPMAAVPNGPPAMQVLMILP